METNSCLVDSQLMTLGDDLYFEFRVYHGAFLFRVAAREMCALNFEHLNWSAGAEVHDREKSFYGVISFVF